MNREAFALLIKLLLEKELVANVEVAGDYVSVIFAKNQGFVIKVMDLVDDINFDSDSFVEQVKKQLLK